MSKFTSGEWMVIKMSPSHKGDKQPIVIHARPSPINSVLAYISGTDEEAEANARLIAKAPKMLELLGKIQLHLEELNNENLLDDYDGLLAVAKDLLEHRHWIRILLSEIEGK